MGDRLEGGEGTQLVGAGTPAHLAELDRRTRDIFSRLERGEALIIYVS